jgi:hypothetical protein
VLSCALILSLFYSAIAIALAPHLSNPNSLHISVSITDPVPCAQDSCYHVYLHQTLKSHSCPWPRISTYVIHTLSTCQPKSIVTYVTRHCSRGLDPRPVLTLMLRIPKLLQERPRPLIFRLFLCPSTGSSHATQDLHARLHTQGAHCRCHCHAMSASCRCHASATSMSCQCHVRPCQTPVLPCHATPLLQKLLRVSCRFRGLPGLSLPFSAYACMYPHDPL